MGVALYGGNAIFGVVLTSKRSRRPRDMQGNAFPGVSGTETLDQGFREMVTEMTGLLYGATLDDLNTAELTVESFDDGVPRAFVDTYSNPWSNVVLRGYTPASKVMRDPRGFFRAYHVAMAHLSPA